MPRASGPSQGFADGDFDLIDNLSVEDGFYPMLFKQMNLTFTDPTDRIIATHFINALEPTGWIGTTVEDIAAESGCSSRTGRSCSDRSGGLNQPFCLPAIWQNV